MTIDEAIEQCEKEAEEYESLIASNDDYNFCQLEWKQSLYEYKQLAEWLKDYKKLLTAIEDIKAEIEQLHDLYKVNIQGHSMSVAQQCLDIINKHTSGKEDV